MNACRLYQLVAFSLAALAGAVEPENPKEVVRVAVVIPPESSGLLG